MPIRSAGRRAGCGSMAQGRMTVSFWFLALAAAGALAGQDLCGLLLGALLHEAGHLAAMGCCGGRIERLTIGVLGAKIIPRYQGIPSTARELVILFAGPAAGILAGLAAARLGFWRFAQINWFLSCFNLLPLSGLDGGSILSLLLTFRFGERGEAAARAVGLFVSILLATACFILYFTRSAAI